MEDRPMTPREMYEKMLETGEVPAGMGGVNAAFAKSILRRQADIMSRESCVNGFKVSEPGEEPWHIALEFSSGEISPEGQRTLARMRSNAHRTEMMENQDNGTVNVLFYVYTEE